MNLVTGIAGDDNPTERPYRSCICPQVPGKTFAVLCDSALEAGQVANVLADLELFMFNQYIMPGYTNTVWVDEWDGEDWMAVDEDWWNWQ